MWEGPGLRERGFQISARSSEIIGRWNLHNGDIKFGKTALDFTYVDLLELTVADVVLLVNDASASTGDNGRRKRSCKDKAGSIGSNHVDKVIRTRNVTTNSAISLAQGT
jgi:hypothetical protein